MKTYLGDGVYADFDGFMVKLTTENDTIFLEPQVWDALQAYVKNVLGGEKE